jgi:hypothetical protein
MGCLGCVSLVKKKESSTTSIEIPSFIVNLSRPCQSFYYLRKVLLSMVSIRRHHFFQMIKNNLPLRYLIRSTLIVIQGHITRRHPTLNLPVTLVRCQQKITQCWSVLR